MTTYRISTAYYVAALVVSEDSVQQAAPVLGWAVGKAWILVRRQLEKHGAIIEPLLQDRPSSVRCGSKTYEFAWRGDRCIRITLTEEGEHPVDLTASEVPKKVLDYMI